MGVPPAGFEPARLPREVTPPLLPHQRLHRLQHLLRRLGRGGDHRCQPGCQLTCLGCQGPGATRASAMLPKCWLVAPVGQWCQKHMAVAAAPATAAAPLCRCAAVPLCRCAALQLCMLCAARISKSGLVVALASSTCCPPWVE